MTDSIFNRLKTESAQRQTELFTEWIVNVLCKPVSDDLAREVNAGRITPDDARESFAEHLASLLGKLS